jgi:hypothetical protein
MNHCIDWINIGAAILAALFGFCPRLSKFPIYWKRNCLVMDR